MDRGLIGQITPLRIVATVLLGALIAVIFYRLPDVATAVAENLRSIATVAVSVFGAAAIAGLGITYLRSQRSILPDLGALAAVCLYPPILLYAALYFLARQAGEGERHEWLTESIDPTLSMLINFAAFLCLWLMVTALICRFIFKESLADLGWIWTPSSAGELLRGLGFGVTIMTAAAFGAVATGAYSLPGFNTHTESMAEMGLNMIRYFGIFLLGAASEELLFRGYILRRLTRRYGLVFSLAVSSVLYSFIHLNNPDTHALAFFGIFLNGLLLGYAFMRNRSLWWCIGAHCGWNFALGPLLSMKVSGFEVHGLFETQIKSTNAFFTGGEFGPEASIFTAAAVMVGVLLISIKPPRSVEQQTGESS